MANDSRPASSDGTVYLLHLDPPVKHARHYTGWTSNLDERLEAHRAGRGARLLEVAVEAGGTFRLVRTWPGSRALERAIKDIRNAPQLCPECSPRPRLLVRGRASGRVVRPEPAAEAEARTVPEPGHWPGLAPELPSVQLASPEELQELMPVIDRLTDGWLAELRAEAEAEADLELLSVPRPYPKEHPVSKHSDAVASLRAAIADGSRLAAAVARAEADRPVRYSLTPEAAAVLDEPEAEAEI